LRITPKVKCPEHPKKKYIFSSENLKIMPLPGSITKVYFWGIFLLFAINERKERILKNTYFERI